MLSLQDLKSWGAQERSLSASTRRNQGQLAQLQGQQDERESRVGQAQKHVTECLRQVEKLQELSRLMAQEST